MLSKLNIKIEYYIYTKNYRKLMCIYPVQYIATFVCLSKKIILHIYLVTQKNKKKTVMSLSVKFMATWCI